MQGMAALLQSKKLQNFTQLTYEIFLFGLCRQQLILFISVWSLN